MTALWVIVLCGALSIVYAIWATASVMKADAGNPRMQEIAAAVREGAQAYLKRQYMTIGMVGIVIFALLYYFLGMLVAVGFAIGAVLSGAAGFIGMNVSVRANVRTAQAATVSLAGGLELAFKAGAITGMLVAGLALLGVTLYFGFLTYSLHLAPNSRTVIDAMVALGFGASLISIFARLGGGIFTKGADVGGDLVGKVEAGIPEDDPRNPATIADNVGDNVGDVAGMGADLYESYAGSILATAALGAALPMIAGQNGDYQIKAIIAPMLVSAIGVLLSIAGIYMVRTKESASQKTLLRALLLGTGGSSSLTLVVLAVMAAANWITWGVFGAAVSGLVAGVIIGQATEYYTSDGYKPTQGIAKQSQTGPATVIIEGMAVGTVSYTHLRAHETRHDLVCRLLLEKKK